MAISIPSRNDKLVSQIKDGLRILAWQEYKNQNQTELKGLELYELFKTEWLADKIQKYKLQDLNNLISELGYTLSDIVQIRGDYYRNKADYKQQSNSLEQPF